METWFLFYFFKKRFCFLKLFVTKSFIQKHIPIWNLLERLLFYLDIIRYTMFEIILICQANLVRLLNRLKIALKFFLLNSVSYAWCFWRHRHRILQSLKVVKLFNFLFRIVVITNFLYQQIFWAYLVVTFSNYSTIVLYRCWVITLHSRPILSFISKRRSVSLSVVNLYRIELVIAILIEVQSILLFRFCKIICCLLKNKRLGFLRCKLLVLVLLFQLLI